MPKREPTISDVLEAINDFASTVDKRFDAADKRFDEVDRRFPEVDKRFDEVDKKFVSSIAASEHRLKSYIDDKLADHTAELFKRLDARYRGERQFFDKIVVLFRQHHIGSPEDIAFLEGLARGF